MAGLRVTPSADASGAYPRDMIGYGRERPDADWPGGARIAVQIVVNYEEGGENNVLHGDAASEAFLSEIVGAEAWPGERHMNMESIYEYGSRAGFWRLHRMLRDVPVTVFGVATAMARNPRAVAAMGEAGWEIASHGWKWIDYRAVPPAVEREHLERAFALHEELTGAPPAGLYQGRTSASTIAIAEDMGVGIGSGWLADSYADDLPYYLASGALVVPYTLDANDMRFATAQGFNSGAQFETYLGDTFDVLLREGRAGRAAMMSVGLHCRLAGRPGRAAALGRFLERVRACEDAWLCTRGQIADHWRRRHPPE